jgi:flagellar motor switch protein FliM
MVPRRNGTKMLRTAAEAQEFDFRRPNKLSREYVRALQIVQDQFARGVTTQLSSTLRAVTSAVPREIDQRTYDEFLRSLGNPSVVVMLQLAPLPGAMVFTLPLSVAYAIVELQLGGTLRPDHPDRALTDIEVGVLRFFIIERILPELRLALDSLVDVTTRIVAIEANPQFASIAAPTDMVVVLSTRLRIEEIEEDLAFCVPFSTLQPVLEGHVSANLLLAAAPDAAASLELLRDRVAEVPVVASARLEPASMPSQALFALQLGDVIRFPHHVDHPVKMSVDGTDVFAGSFGVTENGRRMALRVVSVLSS